MALPSLLLVAGSPIFQDELEAQTKALLLKSFEYPVWLSQLSPQNGVALAISMFLPKLRFLSALMVDRYLDNSDGTVTDVETDLQWMRFSLGQEWKDGTCTGEAKSYTWQEALDAARELNHQGGYAGYQDWRVPTEEELQTLIYSSSGLPKTWNDTGDPCKGNYERPTIYQPAFPTMSTVSWFWSSSVSANYPDRAWGVNFYYGVVVAHGKVNDGHLRLVRGGQ